MTQEEKQLLLIDLSARLPYGVKMWFPSAFAPIVLDEFILNVARKRDENFKPYLRPMSSMTLEEIEDLAKSSGLDLTHRFADVNTLKTLFPVDIFHFSGVVDWLNAHHFDYRGLIEKGLALEAKEGMYEKF